MIAFVRHGESEHNQQGRLGGLLDAALTARGRRQAAALGEALAAERPVAVCSSPLARARDTAAAIAEVAGVLVEVDDRLVELDYGDWDGRPVGEVPASDWRRWRDDPDFAPPGGESLRAVRARAGAFCESQLGGAAAEGVVVAVSHVSPIKAALAWSLGVGDEVAFRAHLSVASVTRIGPGPRLLSFNETAHLGGVRAPRPDSAGRERAVE